MAVGIFETLDYFGEAWNRTLQNFANSVEGGQLKLIPRAKSGIHIKKKNRGKFTKSAKAAGLSILEHARSVLNNPNATPLQKKRANFARNAAKWHKK